MTGLGWAVIGCLAFLNHIKALNNRVNMIAKSQESILRQCHGFVCGDNTSQYEKHLHSRL